MDCAEIIASGKVQGVWFRDYVKRSAVGLNLKGWVKNNLDGTVTVEVEGEKKVIEELIELVRIGSPMSRVDSVSVNWFVTSNNYQEFKIIRLI